MDELKSYYDVIILGAGPAGLQAAIHAVRKKIDVLVLGRPEKSSLIKAHIGNYCCMENVISGETFLEQGKRQAQQAGVTFAEEDVIDLDQNPDKEIKVTLESGKTLNCGALILAMGISRNKLNVKGEKNLIGKGVSYCVDCDGQFFKDQVVTVVGDESAAASGALTLLMIAKEVHMVYGDLKINERLEEQIQRSDIVKHPARKVVSIEGADQVEGIVLDNGQTIATNGVFIELGAKGAIELATKLGVMLDMETFQFIVTNKKQETNIPGIYAAGDICGPPWQVAKAVGEGCVAGLEAASFAKKMKKQ